MRSHLVNIPPRFVVRRNPTEGILSYDLDNAYPQRVMDIIKGSATAFKCNDVYAKFINGQGFQDASFYKAKINDRGQTTDVILRKTAADLAMFRGFALHINYNANYQISEVSHIPFEHCRLAIDKDSQSYNAKSVAVYIDWSRKLYTRIKRDEIDYINFFNPENVEAEVIAAGGFDKYKGQILWYSQDGYEYPTASADPVLEDCVTDAEIKTAKWKNATTNFMPSHLFISRIREENEEQRNALVNDIRQFQGAENASKVMIIESESEDTDPKIEKIDVQDVDKLFQYTEGSVQDNIRTTYGIPSVLIGKEVAGKLGTSQEIEQAVNYYSYQTANERLIIEEIFTKVFSLFYTQINPSNNYSIIPLKYGATNIGG